MKRTNLSLRIKEALLDKRASLVGFADLIELPPDIRHSMRFAISIGVALNPSIIAKIHTGPNPEYYAEYKRANALLSDLGEYAADMVRDHGYQASPQAPTNVGIDPKTHSTALPHKTVATRAGLGWIGKCALLVTEQFGSAIRLTTVLTDAPLETGIPIGKSRCGDCTVCVALCPGKAPSGKEWTPSLHRDLFFDVQSCHKTARRLAKKVGINQTICGICIAVCPWTIRYIKRTVDT